MNKNIKNTYCFFFDNIRIKKNLYFLFLLKSWFFGLKKYKVLFLFSLHFFQNISDFFLDSKRKFIFQKKVFFYFHKQRKMKNEREDKKHWTS